ncbi:MAG: stage III sporulation protein AC [Clostridia bacterium]|nr:stage III sporulation protein AC [Clostridia bacterium]
MNVDLIFRIAAIGIIVAVLNQLLVKSGRDEQAMLVTLAGLIVVLAVIVREVSMLFGTIKSVFGL